MKLVATRRGRRGTPCAVDYCRRAAAPGRSICHKHHHERKKAANPLGYWFQALRGNARRRGHAFELTVDQFRDFCARTGYLELKGRACGCAHIDRIDPRRGYCVDNIQIMEAAGNVRKRYVDARILAQMDGRAAPDYLIDVSDIIDCGFGHPIATIYAPVPF